MARAKNLTDKEVAKLLRHGAPGRHLDSHSKDRVNRQAGLYLVIGSKSAAHWELRYQLDYRTRFMGLGSASTLSLKEARQRAKVQRQLLLDKIDPLEVRRAKRAADQAAKAQALTFAKATERYHTQNAPKWRSAIHREQFLISLQTHAFPVLGEMDVAVIDNPAVMRVLAPIWNTKTITADRVRNRIEAILDWATVMGHRPPGTNPARWVNNLDQVLGEPRSVAPVKNFAALDYREMPAFMTGLRAHEGTAGRALEFLILTAARTGEVIRARWSEIDIDQKLWTIPAERMKGHKEHQVLLSPAAVDLLRDLPTETGNEFVFNGRSTGQPMSKMGMTRVMQQLDRSVTVHGFRSTFSDWAHEQTAHSDHAIEISLSHNVGNEVERSYRRGPMLKKRIALMADWARYCAAPPIATGNNVTPLRGRRR